MNGSQVNDYQNSQKNKMYPPDGPVVLVYWNKIIVPYHSSSLCVITTQIILCQGIYSVQLLKQ